MTQQANALPGWDHLKFGAMYTIAFVGEPASMLRMGQLVDAQVIVNRAGYPATILLAFTFSEDAKPATIPLAALAYLEPVTVDPAAPAG